jgi:alpha-beta hydrolase superfamily lysophospholipase
MAIARADVLVPSPSALGQWEGSMRRGAASLPVRFDLDAGPPASGTFSAPDLGAIGVPLAHVELGANHAIGPSLHWALVGDSSTIAFDATLSGDTIAGSFREANKPDGTFELNRVTGADALPYLTQQALFSNGAVTLAGTVFVPRSPGKHAAAALVQGSGGEGRWALAYVADYLARHGIVALVYDKRGAGASSGDWRTATMDDLAGDARAAVDVLARRADVDPARLGIYGHSQGAELAPQVAAGDSAIRWVAAADGPVGPEYQQDLFRVDTLLAKTYSGGELSDAEKVYAEFVDAARNGASHDALRADIAKAGKAAWLEDLDIPDDSSWIWSWYRQIGNYDNSAAWSRVTVPVLLLFGADDRLVPRQQTIAETTRLLKTAGNSDVTVHIFSGADHTLHVPPATADGWPRIAPGLLGTIGDFAERAGHEIR